MLAIPSSLTAVAVTSARRGVRSACHSIRNPLVCNLTQYLIRGRGEAIAPTRCLRSRTHGHVCRREAVAKNMRGELAQARPVTFSVAATAAGTRIKSAWRETGSEMPAEGTSMAEKWRVGHVELLEGGLLADEQLFCPAKLPTPRSGLVVPPHDSSCTRTPPTARSKNVYRHTTKADSCQCGEYRQLVSFCNTPRREASSSLLRPAIESTKGGSQI